MHSCLYQFLIDNYNLLPTELGQKLLLYIAFEQRFHQKYNIPFDPSTPLEGSLPMLFRHIPRYDLKDAAITLDSAISWSIVQNDPELVHRLNHLRIGISRSNYATADWLLQQATELLEFNSTAFGIDVTPPSVRILVSTLASQMSAGQIIDLCSGTFLLGLQLWQELGASDEVSCYGEEINPFLCALSRILLSLCNVRDFSVQEKNAMHFVWKENHTFSSPSVYIADFPLAGNRTFPMSEADPLFSERPINLYSDWLFIRSVCNRMQTGDLAILIVTKGALVRKNEEFLREDLVANSLLRAVIKLPIGLYGSHSLPMNILVLEKSGRPQSHVFFADLSTYCVSNPNARNVQSISEKAISKVAHLYKSLKSEDGFSTVKTIQEIQKANYTFYPPVFLNTVMPSSEQISIGKIATVIRGLQLPRDYSLISQGARYFLNIRDIQNGEFRYDTADQIAEINPLWELKYRIQEDDIVLTSKGSALKVVIVPPAPPPSYISGNLTILRVDKNQYSPYVLYEYLNSEEGQKALSLIQTGTTIRVLGSTNLERLMVPSFNSEKANQIGISLKNAALAYKQSMHSLTSNYQREKEGLFSQLK